jgi:hypothetical protein
MHGARLPDRNMQLLRLVAALCHVSGKGKGKAVSLQAWSGPEGSRKLKFQEFMTVAQDGGKVVSLMHRPPLPPGNTPGSVYNNAAGKVKAVLLQAWSGPEGSRKLTLSRLRTYIYIYI